MSEDAPVNIGAVLWPDPYSAGVAVRSMQNKLHRWATEDSGRRFDDLFNLVYDPAFLVAAWQRVSTNRGAKTPGIDKVTVATVETRIGVEAFLGQIRDSLKSGEYRPVGVRQVMIPKGVNTGKFRKLGIPTIADRVVQASLKSVLEPIFEANFKPCSYGSARSGALMMRSLRSTIWPPGPGIITGYWSVTSKPVSTRSVIRP
ncbi:hypothetical protein [Actinoallomurus sp. CA-150999]|uniref:hypothetical protein n=1 Tax=Actinoallomurus sp. CA-150999 TaxID=3239887 RepID=UPI003D8B4D18